MYPRPIILLGTPEGAAVAETSSRRPHSVPLSQGGTLGAYGPPLPPIYPEKTVKALRAAQARAPLIATGNRSNWLLFVTELQYHKIGPLDFYDF